MKSKTGLDEIFSLRLQMKLNPYFKTLQCKISPRSDFIHSSGFIPTKADLVEKDSELDPILRLFLVQAMRFELTRIASLASETNAYANSATPAYKVTLADYLFLTFLSLFF